MSEDQQSGGSAAHSAPPDRDEGPYFAVEVEPSGDALRVILRGELDAATAPQLAAALARAASPGRDLALDLGELTFIDSSGLRVIASELQRYEQSHTGFTVVRSSESVRRIFLMTGLGDLLVADPDD